MKKLPYWSVSCYFVWHISSDEIQSGIYWLKSHLYTILIPLPSLLITVTITKIDHVPSDSTKVPDFSVTNFMILFLSLVAKKVGGKKICKHFVQKGLGLASEDTENGNYAAGRVPLIVCITRLVAQKGLHLIRHAIKLVEQLVSGSSSNTLTVYCYFNQFIISENT